MHRKYGPIIRINPHELVIKDPDYYNELYVSASTRKTDAYVHFLAGLNLGEAHVMTVPHDLHRRRRKPLEPFFSKQGIGALEPVLSSLTRRLCDRIDSHKGTSKVIRLNNAFYALTGDVITRICCDEHPDLIEDENFSPSWPDSFKNLSLAAHVVTHFPQILIPILIAPTTLIDWLNPKYKAFRESEAVMRQHVARAKAGKAEGRTYGEGHPTLLRHIAHSEMPVSELDDTRLAREAQVIISAGVHTTSRCLEYIAYHLIEDEKIRFQLQRELEPIMAGYPEKVPSVSQLEKLPYLSGVVKEGLRMADIAMHRLPRVSPEVPLKYKDWIIPKGVAVGMHPRFMNTDPEIYPEPHKFWPDRWVGDIDPRMDRCFVPFVRGSRDCLGKNLAYAELRTVIACLFRPNGPVFELFETDYTDVEPIHDYVVGLPKLNSKGVRVLVH
ncbi:MAG: hypothetical protein HETSPECPRED_009704 [Heterodermia speciosa]|uniref:Cytochrome P450 n=1 Tax=Heterodermia speciosa TaxID=116794 RepID=A0A8H3IYY2_9LECA|nr:MAG: hypothetical protein HETSPECPRED_009704 [Heterodermia speciosa]